MRVALIALLCHLRISLQQIPDAAENRSFLAPAAADAWNRLVDPSRQPAERQRLQPDAPGAGQRGEEQSFAAEERRLDPADKLDVVADRRLQGDDAAGINAERLAGQKVEGMQHPAGMDEAEAVAFEALHDEPFAAEQPHAEAPLKRDADRHATCRAEKRILLADQRAAQLLQIHRQDLSRIRRRERDVLLAVALVGEDRHEEAFRSEEHTSELQSPM